MQTRCVKMYRTVKSTVLNIIIKKIQHDTIRINFYTCLPQKADPEQYTSMGTVKRHSKFSNKNTSGSPILVKPKYKYNMSYVFVNLQRKNY